MFSSKKNIISAQVIESKTNNIMKRIIRDAKKKIKNGELKDSHSFELYLQTIDSRYMHIIAEIRNATLVVNYDDLRAHKIAETRELLAFFDRDYAELDSLSKSVALKAQESGKMNEFKHEQLSTIDLTKLTNNFNKLERKTD